MSRLFSDVEICEERPEGQNGTFYTLQTNDGNVFLIDNCHELLNPLYLDWPKVFWGVYNQTANEGTHHQVKAFIYEYQKYVDLLICE